jgi:Iap family predicted aminopeptidase
MIVALGMLGLMLQADFTEFSPGASDNASGVGVVLSLAERLAVRPLKNTAVWVVLTGCEEVGCYGAEDFIRRHKAELGHAAWISVDTVGSTHGAPVILSQETFLATSKSDPMLLRAALDISFQYPDLGAHEIRMTGAYTEGAIGVKHGLRVLTLESHQPDGTLSHWHRPTDTIQNVSPECLLKTESLLYELLLGLDRNASSDG